MREIAERVYLAARSDCGSLGDVAGASLGRRGPAAA
jgi:hypothetical protein